MTRPHPTIADFNARAQGHFPAFLGITLTEIGERSVTLQLPIRPELLAPNNYLHAGAIVTLADTAAGYGCLANLPEGASSFTTIELKSNFLGTARDGHLRCTATAAHLGGRTHVWDVIVTHVETGKTIALFRCTQMILSPKQG